MSRGFTRADLRALDQVFTGENHPFKFVDRIIDNDPLIIATLERKEHSDAELLDYLQHHERLDREANRKWAMQALEALSLQGRRILISYAYESWVPYTVYFYKEGPNTQEEIMNLRLGLEQRNARERMQKENN